jgi:hypothetical protein
MLSQRNWTCSPLADSQNATVLSLDADASLSPEGLHATLFTSAVCPSSLGSCYSIQTIRQCFQHQFGDEPQTLIKSNIISIRGGEAGEEKHPSPASHSYCPTPSPSCRPTPKPAFHPMGSMRRSSPRQYALLTWRPVSACRFHVSRVNGAILMLVLELLGFRVNYFHQ